MILNRRQVRLLIPLGLAISLSLPGDQTLYAVLPTQHGAVGISLGMVGVLLGINRVIRIPGNPVAGLLYDQLGRRCLFLLGLLLGLLSTASYAMARNFSAWLAGRLLWGVAWSLINVGGLTMVLDVTEDHDRGRVTGLYQMSYLVGLAFSPVLGGLLTDAVGFRPALLICAAITGSGLFLAFFTLPETRPTPAGASTRFQSLGTFVASFPQRKATDKQTSRQTSLSGGLPWPAWRSHLHRARAEQVAINYTYLMTFFAGNGVVMSTISLYLKQNFGDEILFGKAPVGVASLGGTLLAMRSLMGMVAGPLSGYLSDRLGDRWPIARWGIVMGGVGFGVLIAGRGMWTVPVGVALIALSSGALLTSLAALTGDLAASDRQGLAMGGLATAGDLGSAAGPLLAYALLSLVDLRWVYLLCGLGFASSLLVMRLARAGRRPTADRRGSRRTTADR
jgi:MFS family permease